jgi:hypothetical protein
VDPEPSESANILETVAADICFWDMPSTSPDVLPAAMAAAASCRNSIDDDRYSDVASAATSRSETAVPGNLAPKATLQADRDVKSGVLSDAAPLARRAALEPPDTVSAPGPMPELTDSTASSAAFGDRRAALRLLTESAASPAAFSCVGAAWAAAAPSEPRAAGRTAGPRRLVGLGAAARTSAPTSSAFDATGPSVVADAWAFPASAESAK